MHILYEMTVFMQPIFIESLRFESRSSRFIIQHMIYFFCCTHFSLFPLIKSIFPHRIYPGCILLERVTLVPSIVAWSYYPAFVLLFMSQDYVDATGPLEWEEAFLVGLFEELEIFYVTTRRDLWSWAERAGIEREALYRQEGIEKGHHSRAGNEAALQTILRGLRGEFDPYEFVPGKR